MSVELTCIVCPRGCHLVVHDDLTVEGNSCPRGAAYGKQEVLDPRRTVTSTVPSNSVSFKVCPVKTKDPVPKANMAEVMAAINAVRATVPVRVGDVLIHDVAGTGVDVVATRDLLE